MKTKHINNIENSHENFRILLEEYKLCANRADHFSSLIWQLATFIITLSGGGILLVFQAFDSTFFGFCYIVVLVCGIDVSLWWWSKVANRWSSYINVYYTRMKELENELDNKLWSNRYINILDRQQRGEVLNELDYTKFTYLEKEMNLRKYSRSSINQLRHNLLIGIGIVWFILLILLGLNFYQGGCLETPGWIPCNWEIYVLLPTPMILVVVFITGKTSEVYSNFLEISHERKINNSRKDL